MHSPSRTFGLIGFPLGHSWSKSFFTGKFEQEGLQNHRYRNFEIPSITLLENIIRENEDLVGLNVTIPYKQSVMRYLDQVDPVADEIGAVNTIRINRSPGKCTLSGYNTDAIGFTRSLNRWTLNGSEKALVFGSGGSSLAVKYALARMGLDYITVSREKKEGFITYDALNKETAMGCRLWINCTPVGMFPDLDARLPLPYQYLTPGHFLFDLVYNPEITGFLRMGIEAGARVMNGSAMLYEQAGASWEIWNR